VITVRPAGRGSATAAPLWLQMSTLALSAGGLGVSLYLTVAHYTTSVTLACPDTGLVNCEKVTTSPQSVLFGTVPVALLGLAFYVAMVAMHTPWARGPGARGRREREHQDRLHGTGQRAGRRWPAILMGASQRHLRPSRRRSRQQAPATAAHAKGRHQQHSQQ
jgi:hypothetical protein